jgi:hypothetical protein
MIDPIVRIAQEGWPEWLFAVANTGGVRQVEVPVDLLEEASLKAKLERYGVRAVHGRELLSSPVGRYFWETTAVPWEQVLGELKERLQVLNDWRIGTASLDLGMDRILAEGCEQGLGQRVDFLRSLYPEVEALGVCLCIGTRYPREYPFSKAWEYAVNLVREIGGGHCRLGLDLFPGELAADFDIAAFVRRVYLTVGVVRFHFNPSLGENLDNMRADEWLKALLAHEFRGQFVFCPERVGMEECAQVCAQVDRCCQNQFLLNNK